MTPPPETGASAIHAEPQRSRSPSPLLGAAPPLVRLHSEVRADPGVGSPSRYVFALFTAQDVLLLAYLFAAWVFIWGAGPSPMAEVCAERIYLCVAVVLIGCLLSRTPGGLSAPVRWVIYRAVLAGVLIDDYVMLRDLLPVVRPDTVDATLLHIDVAVLGFEPALWLERFNRTPIVEYFAFFYFSYFFICTGYLVAVAVFSKGGTQTTEFAIGTFIVFCAGQIGYMAVPAFGPIRFLASEFSGPVHGGFFWGCVTATVQAGSAMKDVFPSLHTAVPTWLTFFALRRARFDSRWKWPARITGFFAANIIVSTMLLRWHYAIDIVAGLMLASLAAFVSVTLTRREEAFRKRNGLPLPWAFSDEGYR